MTIREISIPKDALVIMMAPAGAGKTWFAEKHFPKGSIVASDTCREMICGDAGDQTIHYQTFEMFHTWISLRLSIGQLTVADSTAIKAHARRRLKGLAYKHHKPVVVIALDYPIEEIFKRNKSRDRVVPEDVIIRMYDIFRASLRHLRIDFQDGQVEIVKIGDDVKITLV